MEEEPEKPKGKLGRAVVFPLVVATTLAVAIQVFAPEVGMFGIASAWIGTVLVLGVWGMLT